MTTHIALIRGVNVGNNVLRMEQLREMLAGLGFANVRTYLQSGNALFTAKGSRAQLAAVIEKKVGEATRLPVTVIVRTPADMQRLIAGNPYVKEAAAEPRTVHVTFLAGAASKLGIATVGNIDAGHDRWYPKGDAIYLCCPNGYGRSRLNNAALERALGMRATTRNWSTVTALRDMASE
jgi:uncharacterized protein (DUF1697 family)